jgi:hypothetical protein
MTKFNLTDSTLLLEIYLDNELLVPFPESNEYQKDEWHLAGVKKKVSTTSKYTKKIYWPIFKMVYFLQSIQRFFLPYS